MEYYKDIYGDSGFSEQKCDNGYIRVQLSKFESDVYNKVIKLTSIGE